MRNIKPTHKPIKTFYAELKQYEKLGATNETEVRLAFATLLQHYARQNNLTLICEKQLRTLQGTTIYVDGMLTDNDFGLPRGYWEAKDLHDNLTTAVRQKFDVGYPQDNILFTTQKRAILYQDRQEVLDVDITEPDALIRALHTFFGYEQADIADWERAVVEFKDKVPALGKRAAALIKNEEDTNTRFQEAFTDFHRHCQEAINPNLAKAAIEEMLIQHLLTEEIFSTVFDNRDFTRRNIIAREIENLIDALTEHAYNRAEFLRELAPFYSAIQRAAATFIDFSQKQHFLNTVYEQFFQGFSVKVADTHGIVYTPQPIVNFMVKSVSHLLATEFGRSLSDTGVHIIDPFVGTGNFIVRLIQAIDKTALKAKYSDELHCNEVLLMPYYIASMNIEHEFYVATNQYQPFDNLCLVDTFDLTAERQLSLFAPENTRRVERQKKTEMFVVIGNPPYNARQMDENDANKNRKYPELDRQIQETYAQASNATNKTALYDPYVKAIHWALDRVKEKGIVAFVTNHNFIDGQAFDGMRKHLSDACDKIYLLDLGGNIRKGQGGDANVFDIQVGVSINLFVKKRQHNGEVRTETPQQKHLASEVKAPANIFYNDETAEMPKEATFEFLDASEHIGNINWNSIQPDARHTWLTEGLREDFETFLPMGSKQAKTAKGEVSGVIFHQFSSGVKTNRDAWTINFDPDTLTTNVQRMIEFYNTQVFKWQGITDKSSINIDDFAEYDDAKISWSRDLKAKMRTGRIAEYDEHKIRTCLYRPFAKRNIFFDRLMAERVYVFPSIFPTPETEAENRVICVNISREKPFTCLMTDRIPEHIMTGGFGSAGQCFPFYIYDEDGSNRRENITDWALAQFREHYKDANITKWDIFHYTYALLHHPAYREQYQVNLKRDLPHIPYASKFWEFVEAGRRLADIHIHYEDQPQYKLDLIEAPDMPLDWRVEQMKFSKDKTQIKYNDFLTVAGIPAEAFQYRLGNRAALEWVVDQYRVKTDKRSGIINDPNRTDDETYIVDLIRKVISVSLETVRIVERLSGLDIGGEE
ncbi:MAG: N-6 DNA methylase [Candidatus Poribacteria bacterium]|nr:N-6 DNA methylase [Candidatus Poribacteria bacterium]